MNTNSQESFSRARIWVLEGHFLESYLVEKKSTSEHSTALKKLEKCPVESSRPEILEKGVVLCLGLYPSMF